MSTNSGYSAATGNANQQQQSQPAAKSRVVRLNSSKRSANLDDRVPISEKVSSQVLNICVHPWSVTTLAI